MKNEIKRDVYFWSYLVFPTSSNCDSSKKCHSSTQGFIGLPLEKENYVGWLLKFFIWITRKNWHAQRRKTADRSIWWKSGGAFQQLGFEMREEISRGGEKGFEENLELRG